MPAVATVSEFLEVARKSNQIDPQRLETFLASRDSLPPQPRRLAAMLIREGLITTFQAEQFLLGKYKGFYLGGYRIIERIGCGGAGTVYLAEHQMMKRRAAIKVLPTALAEDPVMLERFRIEAQAAAALDHPNVVHLFDFRQEGRLYYIIMEYIDGPNLQQVLSRKGPPAVAVACEYIRQAALGLQHAHDLSFVHRDVKPANILVDSTGIVKVLDLGLARVERPDGESVTQKHNSSSVLGTADYLSPEQALNLHEVDPRADVYSLGATFYALLTGQPPFHNASSVAQKLMWHQTRPPVPLKAIRAEIPREVSDLVACMLAKKPEDRPQTMLDVVEALLPWASQAPPAARSPRSLVEIRLGGPRTDFPGRTSTDHLLPSNGAPETVMTLGQEDTGQLEGDPPAPVQPPLRDITLGAEQTSRKLLVLGGLAVGMLAVAAGVIALLLWGPSP
jgi:serine/threonine protein kinase